MEIPYTEVNLTLCMYFTRWKEDSWSLILYPRMFQRDIPRLQDCSMTYLNRDTTLKGTGYGSCKVLDVCSQQQYRFHDASWRNTTGTIYKKNGSPWLCKYAICNILKLYLKMCMRYTVIYSITWQNDAQSLGRLQKEDDCGSTCTANNGQHSRQPIWRDQTQLAGARHLLQTLHGTWRNHRHARLPAGPGCRGALYSRWETLSARRMPTKMGPGLPPAEAPAGNQLRVLMAKTLTINHSMCGFVRGLTMGSK